MEQFSQKCLLFLSLFHPHDTLYCRHSTIFNDIQYNALYKRLPPEERSFRFEVMKRNLNLEFGLSQELSRDTYRPYHLLWVVVLTALRGPMLMMQLLVQARKKMSFFSKPRQAATMTRMKISTARRRQTRGPR